jgi:hypothetical protein
VIEGDARADIEAAMEHLNEKTSAVAAQMMNEVLQVTVHGKTLREVLGEKRRTPANLIQLT